jgi:hypothetical protein
MTSSQEMALGSRERMQGYVRQMWKEFALFELSGIGLVGLSTVTYASWKSNSSPELTVATGIGAFGCFAVSLLELDRMMEIQRKAKLERANRRSFSDDIEAIIAPLGNKLPLDEKKALIDSQSGMTPPLLVSGQPDLEGMVLATVPDDGSSLSTVAKEREVALYFISTRLLDQEVIGADGLSCIERTKILRALTNILAPKPTSAGLTLTRPELDFLIRVTGLGAVTEKAPETKSAYLRWFGRLIESYIPHKRISPAGQDMVNTLMSQAIQAERLAGCSVSPPIGLWRDAQRLKKEEKGRVILTEEQLMDMAKSVTALANSRTPEARETYMKIFPRIIEILGNERKRLEGLKEKDTDSLAAINTVLFILQISINDLVDRETISQINQLCGERLAKKRKITPRDLIDELETIEFGSITKEGDTTMIRAKNIVLADVLACAAVICDPYTPWIEVCVGMSDDKPVQSAAISTAVFYSQRLILKDRQFISELLRDQSPHSEPMSFKQNLRSVLPMPA